MDIVKLEDNPKNSHHHISICSSSLLFLIIFPLCSPHCASRSSNLEKKNPWWKHLLLLIICVYPKDSLVSDWAFHATLGAPLHSWRKPNKLDVCKILRKPTNLARGLDIFLGSHIGSQNNPQQGFKSFEIGLSRFYRGTGWTSVPPRLDTWDKGSP